MPILCPLECWKLHISPMFQLTLFLLTTHDETCISSKFFGVAVARAWVRYRYSIWRQCIWHLELKIWRQGLIRLPHILTSDCRLLKFAVINIAMVHLTSDKYNCKRYDIYLSYVYKGWSKSCAPLQRKIGKSLGLTDDYFIKYN